MLLMQGGYWPIDNDESTLFQALIDAIKGYDEGYVTQSINLHPSLLEYQSPTGETLRSFLQKTQTSTNIKSFVDNQITEHSKKKSTLK